MKVHGHYLSEDWGHVVSSSALHLLELHEPDSIIVCHIECRGVAGGVELQNKRSTEPGVGAGAVGGPLGALHAGDGRDLVGIGIHNADGVVLLICHIQLVAGDGQAVRTIELGIGAGAVGGPGGALHAGEGRDHCGPGVDHSECVVEVV